MNPIGKRSTFLAGLGLGAALAAFALPALDDLPERPQASPTAPQDAASAADVSAAFRRASARIGPSVVSINAVPASLDQRRLSEIDFESFMRAMPQTVIGSGVVIRADGHIVTNFHVAAAARSLAVTLPDKRVKRARLVGADRYSDLAVLRIDADDLVPAVFAPFDSARVGDWVLAAGSPFGLSHTVTAGIVSAVARADIGIAEYEEFIQTDAAINPGNSGGALVDTEGRLIGINTAIASRTGAYAGVGFAIPVRMVRAVVDRLIEKGVFERAFLGANITDLDLRTARALGLESTRGSIIESVLPDSPAERAALRAGDVILTFDGVEVRDANSLRNRVSSSVPGTAVPVGYVRDGELRETRVALGSLETRN